jgi:hypothetical protein
VVLEKDGEDMGSTDRVENEEVLHREEKARNILRKVNHGKGKWIGYT